MSPPICAALSQPSRGDGHALGRHLAAVIALACASRTFALSSGPFPVGCRRFPAGSPGSRSRRRFVISAARMAWYDPESRTLFSGDLFGGLNQLGRVHLFAEEADWGGDLAVPSRSTCPSWP